MEAGWPPTRRPMASPSSRSTSACSRASTAGWGSSSEAWRSSPKAWPWRNGPPSAGTSRSSIRRNGICLRSARGGAAEAAYLRGIEVARRQGARAFEVRTTARLAELWLRLGRRTDAALLLEPIVGSLAEVSETTGLADLARARELLARSPLGR